MLWSLRIVLTWPNLYIWITCKHSRFLVEPISFWHKSIEKPSLALALYISNILLLSIGSRPWVFVEIFFELNFSIKSSLFGPKLLLAVRLLAICKRGERSVGGQSRGAIDASTIGFGLRFALLEQTRGSWACRKWLLFVYQDSLRLPRNGTHGGVAHQG